MSKESFKDGHALIIGVGSDLPFTVRDAAALYTLLTDPDKAAYLPSQTTLITGKTANKSNIIQAIDDLAEKADPDNSIVIIYFSGPGGFVEQDEEIERDRFFLVPNGFDQTIKTIITEDEFIEKVNKIKAKKIVVILDSDHSGGFAEKFNPTKGRVILAACQAHKNAYSEKKLSVFTKCLLEILDREIPGQKSEGDIKILTIISHLLEEVPKRTAKNDYYPFGQQNPSFSASQSDNFSLCFGPKKAGGSLLRQTNLLEDNKIIQLEIKGFKAELEIYIEKSAYYHEQIAILSDSPTKFEFKKKAIEADIKIDELKTKIKNLST